MLSRDSVVSPILEISGLVLILMGTILLVGQLGNFSQDRQQLPPSLELGEVPVGGLAQAEAQARLERVYGAPITVFYRGQEIRLDPRQVNFTVNSQAMLARADELRTEGTFWSGFWDYIWRRPEQGYSVDLDATYSRELLTAWLEDVAMRYDSPATRPEAAVDGLRITGGSVGYTLDVEASQALIEEALLKPTDREVQLIIGEEAKDEVEIDALRELLRGYLSVQPFEGVVNVSVIDLETGEEVTIGVDKRFGQNRTLECDLAVAGMGPLRIPIATAYLQTVDTPDADLMDDVLLTANEEAANNVLREIGRGSLQDGTQNVTAMLNLLGLDDSYILRGYGQLDEDDAPDGLPTPATDCISNEPPYARQTTTRNMAYVLDMLYQCAMMEGGALIAAYGESISQEDCALIIETMQTNDEANLIEAGLPPDVSVAHKHGWVADTHGDAGIVFSEGGDYVMVVMVWSDRVWLDFNTSFPIIEGLSAATFNYFNPDQTDVARQGFDDDLGEEAPPPPPEEEGDDEGDP